MVEAPKENQAPAMPNDPAIMGVCDSRPTYSARAMASRVEETSYWLYHLQARGINVDDTLFLQSA